MKNSASQTLDLFTLQQALIASVRQGDLKNALGCVGRITASRALTQVSAFEKFSAIVSDLKSVGCDEEATAAQSSVGLACLDALLGSRLDKGVIGRVASEFIREFIESGKADWLDRLLQSSASQSLWQNDVNPIDTAILSQSEEMLAYVLAHEKELGTTCLSGWFQAIDPRTYKMLPALFAAGAQASERNEIGENGLHMWVGAYSWDQLTGEPKEKGGENWVAETLKLLIDHGVNPDGEDHRGLTAIDMA